MHQFKAIAEFYGLYLQRDLGTKKMVLGNYDGRFKEVNLLNADDFRKECEEMSSPVKPNPSDKIISKIEYKSGDVVQYCGIRAVVRSVRQNGIWIDFWGMGLKAGQALTRRVSSRDLKRYYEHVGSE